MVYSIVKAVEPVDQLTLQRCLTVLENRYRELREIGETRLQAWEADRAKFNHELDEITHAKGCLESEIKNLSHLTDVLTSEKNELEAKLEQADQTITGLRVEKVDLESKSIEAYMKLELQLKEALLNSENLTSERQKLHIELKAVRDELELRMLQLLQAQEELQHYFLKSQELLSAHAQTTQAMASASEALQDVLSSTSWRMTYPMRWALDQFHLFRREGHK